MVEKTFLEEEGNRRLATLMQGLLPDLNAIIQRVDAFAVGNQNPEIAKEIAAELHLWVENSERDLTAHYQQYEAPRTIAEREKEGPNAATDAAEHMTQLNIHAALEDHMRERKPKFTPKQEEAFKIAFDQIENLTAHIDTSNVSSFGDRVRREQRGDVQGKGGNGRT